MVKKLPRPDRFNPAKGHQAMPSTINFPELFRPQRVDNFSSYTRPPVVRPGRDQAGEPSTLWAPRMDPDVIAIVEATKEQHAPTMVPEDQRSWVREQFGLRDFYESWVLADLEQRRETKSLSASMLSNSHQALKRWEQFTRPDGWPPDRDWPGFPIGSITPKVVEGFLVRLFAACPAGTARSTWAHVRNIFNHAVRVKALDVVPRPTVIPAGEDGPVEVFTAEQINAGYRSLSDWVDLQVAFVLALNAGPRTVDLFLLQWDRTDLDSTRPHIDFVAKKTGKRQVIPLAPVTVAHLRRLPSRGSSPWLFPDRSNARMENPEHSRPAMRRRAIIKAAFAAVGIHYMKSFQALRATCNTRLETWRTGVGQFVLGHALTLNTRHYFEPSDLIYEGVCSIAQPPAFLEAAG